jgi:hypothetical protein
MNEQNTREEEEEEEIEYDGKGQEKKSLLMCNRVMREKGECSLMSCLVGV